MHFFIDNFQLTEQNISDSFGIFNNDQNLFKITSEFQLLEKAKAFACQDGMIIIQQSAADENLVNIILNPRTGLEIPFSSVKYFVYRGVSKDSLFVNGQLIPKSKTPENSFLQRIWDEVDGFRTNFNLPNHPDPTPKDFGYDQDLPSTLEIEKVFNNSQSNTFPIYIKEGECIGNFGNSKKIGFEIILETDNLENPSFDNQITLGYLRKQNHTIDVSDLSGFEKRAKQELILSYIDPSAFFGLHYDVGVDVSIFSGNTKAIQHKRQTELYTQLLSKFHNKNKIYIDIRSENGYSYNFYQNYKDENNKNIKIENSVFNYETDSWPILILDTHNKTKINLNLRIDDNLKPILFSENKELFEKTNNSCFLDDTKLLNENSIDWTNNIFLYFPTVETKNVAYYAKLCYFRQENNVMHQRRVAKNQSASFGSVFISLDTPNLGNNDYKFQHISNSNFSFLKGNLPSGENFSGVVTAKANFDENQVAFYTRMVFPNETTGEFYAETEAVIGKGISLEGDFNQMSFLKRDLFFISQNIQENKNINPVKVLDILAYKAYPARKECLFLLGITQSELSTLKNVTGLSDKHTRYIGFEDVSPDPATDIEGKAFKKYKLNVQGLDGNGDVAIVNPTADIFVYTIGGFVFCSKGFSDAELITKNNLSSLNLSDYEMSFLNDEKNVAIKLYLENYLLKNSTVEGFEYTKWLVQFLILDEDARSYFSEYSEDLETLSFLNFNPQDISETIAAKAIAKIYALFLYAIKKGIVDQLENNPLWKLAWKAIKEIIIYALRQETILLVKMMNWFIRTFGSTLVPPKYQWAINNNLDAIKLAIDELGLINYNPHTMQWKDIVACWLLEAGDFPINDSTGTMLPTIGFAGTDYVISGIPNHLNEMRYLVAHKTLGNGSLSKNSVMFLRDRTLKQLKNSGSLSTVSGTWGFEWDATTDTIKKKDGLQFCLGSYDTAIYITQINVKKFELTFIIKNKTGWESGTRWLNDNDGNPHNDSVLNDKPRGVGIHLGGTIAQTYGWKEAITIS